jgi:RNA polymerase-interacting CarD/CdnL/TRCF family regulator
MLSLAVGDVVVYRSHGIGCVEARCAGGGDAPDTVVIVFEGGLRVTLPVPQARDALRSPSGELELEDVRRTLRADATESAEPWSRRFRAIREKVAAGSPTGLAEVVRDGLQRERRLAVRSGGPTGAPTERHLYRQARKLLAAEVALARGIDEAEADVWIAAQVGEDA